MPSTPRKVLLRAIVSATAFALLKLLRIVGYRALRLPGSTLSRLLGPKGTSFIVENLGDVGSGALMEQWLKDMRAMPPLRRLLFDMAVSATIFALWKLLRLVGYQVFRKSTLHRLRGPKGTSFVLGNLGDMTSNENGVLVEQWLEEYGNTLRVNGFLGEKQLVTVDTRAVNHVLSHSNEYQKPVEVRNSLGQVFGEGLLVVEGAQHRQQRRILNPAFSPAQIRALTETFFTKADQLCELWFSEIARDPTAAIRGKRMDMVPWMNKLTLDIIGLTGFNYNFDALESTVETNELNKALSVMLAASQSTATIDVLKTVLPVLRFIPSSEARKIQAAKRTMEEIGEELLMNAKAAALASATENGEIEKNSLRGRDLLSLLVKANMATDNPESQRMSDKDVIAQVPTFVVAGHEATSSTITWALYALTQAPNVQTQLRDELLSVGTDAPSMEELMALPYLDAVVRETLRVHAPVQGAIRIAMKDDEVPVEKPYTDRYGVVHKTIAISKGDSVLLPIPAINRSKELWGPDAREFNPERWSKVPEAVSQVPGVWGHMMTFIGGPRACIGYRFSIVETKAILFSLLRAFEFELAVPASEISSRSGVARPVLRSDPTHQTQLPLLVRAYRKM